MKKNIRVFLFFTASLGILGAALASYLKSQRVLSFESHDPLRKDLNDRDFKFLFQIHQDCFAKAKKDNLRRYFMKYESLDAGIASKKADYIIASSDKDREQNFGEMPNAFIMRDRGDLIGLFNCHEENEATHGSMMVFNVCVRKDKQGQGYGRELMKHAIEKCSHPSKELTLSVYKDDTKVVNFYKDLNFTIISNLDEWDHLFPFFNKYLMKYNATNLSESRPY